MNRKIAGALLGALYGMGGLLACATLSALSASAYVQYKHVSNFEGGSGYAAMFQLPLWMLLYLAILLVAYVMLLRKHLVLLAAAVVLLGWLSMPTLSFVAELAWDAHLPPGPLGHL